mgnify:CR=1 FL=1
MTKDFTEAIIKYGVCSTHIDCLNDKFSEIHCHKLINSVIKGYPQISLNSNGCVFCQLDIIEFCRKE